MFDAIGRFGPARDELTETERKALRQRKVLHTDPRRERPVFFNGRFLTAEDLNREQSYFLARQASLGRAIGVGITEGLLVGIGREREAEIVIHPGHGITAAGELVVVDRTLRVDILDIPEIRRLDAAFGIRRLPRRPLRTRSGVFVLALRPVEYTANPTANYPSSLADRSRPRDGDIVEAAAVTLIPYPGFEEGEDAGVVRSRVARDLFIDGVSPGVPAEALPLAMLSLNRGQVEWVDPYLVRRRLGAEPDDLLGLGIAPWVLREAHLRQYQRQLDDVLSELDGNHHFQAAEHFFALPPGGRFPEKAIRSETTAGNRTFTQIFFPPEIDVELAVISEDEVRSALYDSLRLPPIDLTEGTSNHESTSVLVLVPVPRAELRGWMARLQGSSGSGAPVDGAAPNRLTLPSAAPGVIARRRPIELLRGLGRPVPRIPIRRLRAAAWGQVIESAPHLWYVRRRNFPHRESIVGESVPVRGAEAEIESELDVRLRTHGVLTRVRALDATAPARAALTGLLSRDAFDGPSVLIRGAVTALEAEQPLETHEVEKIAGGFGHPELGDGFQRLFELQPALKTVAVRNELVATLRVPDIDRIGREHPDVEDFAKTLLKRAQESTGATAEEQARNRQAKMKSLVTRHINELDAPAGGGVTGPVAPGIPGPSVFSPGGALPRRTPTDTIRRISDLRSGVLGGATIRRVPGRGGG